MNDIDKPRESQPTVPPAPRRSWAARMMSRPPSRTFLAIFALAAALGLYQRSVPFTQISLGLDGLVLIAVPLLLVVWVMRFAGFIVAGATGPPGLAALRRHWLRWSLPLLITVAASVLGSLDAPFRLRFAMSRAAMDRFVAQIESEPRAAGGSELPRATQQQSRRVGLFTVQTVQVQSDGEVILMVKGPFGGASPGGFAHRRTPPPPNPPVQPFFGTGASFYTPIDGLWYRVIYIGI